MSQRQLLYITDNVDDLSAEDRFIGSFLYDPQREVIAKIHGLLVEPTTYLVRFTAITLGGFLMTAGKTVLVPRELCNVVDVGIVEIPHSQEFLYCLPSPSDLENLPPNEEELILSYFDLEPYPAKDSKENPPDPNP